MVVAGEAQLDRGIARFSDGVTDYREIWPVIADEFYAELSGQFDSEGAQSGERWVPLSPAYRAWKERHYPGKPILQRTASLRKSLTKAGDANAVRIEERKGLVLGSKVGYGIYHQSPEARKRLPRRAPIMFTEEFKRGVMRHIQAYLIEVATQVGLRTGLRPTQAVRSKGFRPAVSNDFARIERAA